MSQRRPVDVDVAAVVAEEVAQHAPGTRVAGPDSGGVQVIRVALDVVAFRELLAALSTTLGEGSHLRLDQNGGLLTLDVTGTRCDLDDLEPVRAVAQAMGGDIVPGPAPAAGFCVRVPFTLTEWD